MINPTLRIGVIQTSLDADAAWIDDGSGNWLQTIRMSPLEERRAKKEIRHYLSAFRGLDKQPDIVLLPELSVPMGYERTLIRSAENLESIIIAGMDYRVERTKCVSNEALVIVPQRLRGRRVARRTEIRRVGKSYAAPGEAKKLRAITGGPVEFVPSPEVWIFDSDLLGKFAVAICYDFMDLDRIVMYRMEIQTLFVLAYNRDTTSFDHLAEAIARMVFCNVVICNCGRYGGSFAVSPFKEPYKRTVYKHAGLQLPNAQLIELPLRDLWNHQLGKSLSNEFKSHPPGYPTTVPLSSRVRSV